MHAGNIEHSDTLQRSAAEIQNDAITLGQIEKNFLFFVKTFVLGKRAFYVHHISFYSNIINAFAVTFYQLNASLLNKSINIFTKNVNDPKIQYKKRVTKHNKLHSCTSLLGMVHQ